MDSSSKSFSLKSIIDKMAPNRERNRVRTSEFLRGSPFVSVRDALSGSIPAQAPGINFNLSQLRNLQKVQAWPPAPMTANTTTITGQTYGNGTYVASASSIVSAAWAVWEAFNQDIAIDANPGWHSAFTYNNETGLYEGTVTTIADGRIISGEWIQLQLPTPIVLSSFNMQGRGDNTGITNLTHLRRLPQSYVLAGSNDGAAWTILDDRENVYYTGLSTTFTVDNTNAYTYYRLIGRIVGNHDQALSRNSVNLAEWTLYGAARAANSMYNPRMWLRTEDLSSLEDGDEVRTWPSAFEGGPNAQGFSAGTANLPRIVRPPRGVMPYVQFGNNLNSATDGNWIDFGAQTLNIANNGGFTLFLICRIRVTTASLPTHIIDFGIGASNGNIYLATGGAFSNRFRISYRNGNTNYTTVPLSANEFGSWNVIAMRIKASEIKYWQAADVLLDTVNAPPTLENKNYTHTLIGKPNWNGYPYSEMDIREFIVYDYALSDAEVESVRTYLMAKSDIVAVDRTLQGLMGFDRDVLLDEEAKYTATVTGTVTYAAGVRGGRALSISGNAVGGVPVNFVQYSGATLTTSAGFTVACWVYPFEASATNARIFPICLRGIIGDLNGLFIGLRNNHMSITGWDFVIRDTANASIVYSIPVADAINRWTHLACTVSGTTMTAYVNGMNIGTATLSTGAVILSVMRLGGLTNGSTDGAFNGLIDDVRVYTRALTASDILALVGTTGSTIARIPLGLRAQIGFDADSVVDARGAFTGTVTGTVTYEAGAPGNGGKAVRLSNTVSGTGNNYVNYTFASIPIASGFTCSFWVYPTTTPASGGRAFLGVFHDTVFGSSDTGPSFQLRNNFLDFTGYHLAVWDTSTSTYKIANYTAAMTDVLNRWSHLAYAVQGTTGTFYVNGVRVGEILDCVMSTVNLNNLRFGNDRNGNGSAFDGRIDDVEIFTRALSAHEIAQLCNPITFSQFGFEDSLVDARGLYTPTVTGTVSYTSSVRTVATGKALSFSGNNTGSTPINYVTYSGPESSLLMNGFSVACWVFPTTIPPSGQRSFIFSMRSSIMANGLNFVWRNNNVGITGWDLLVFDTASTSKRVITSTPPDAIVNKWTHIALTLNGTTMTGYIDGVSIGTVTLTTNNIVFRRFRLGGWEQDAPSTAFNGHIDDLQIHTRALSAVEIAALASAKSTVITSISFDEELMARIPFDGETPFDERGFCQVSALNNVSYIGTNERRYPPTQFTDAMYDAANSSITVNVPSFQRVNVAGQPYGNGAYIIKWSGRTGSLNHTGVGAWKAFDGFLGSFYAGYAVADSTTGVVPAGYYVSIVLPAAIKLKRYTVYGSSTYYDASWRFYGVTNAGVEVLLDTETDITSWAAVGESKSFNVTSNATYREYKFLLDKVIIGTTSVRIVDIALYADESGPENVPSGMSGQSLDLMGNPMGDPATRFATYTMPTAINTSNGLTFSLWVYPWSMIGNGKIGMILCSDGNNEFYFTIRNNESGITGWTATRGGAGHAFYTINPASTVNKWTHLVAVISGTTGQLYVNGVLGGSHTNVLWSTLSISGFAIGRVFTTNAQCFNGLIKDVRIYTRALLPSEIAGLAGSSSAPLMSLPPTPDDSLRACITGDNGISSNSMGLAYPPAALSANSTTLTRQRYGNGAYVASASSNTSGPRLPWKMFNKVYGFVGSTLQDDDMWGSAAHYSSESGLPLASAATTEVSGSSISGEWCQIELPSTIIIHAYTLHLRLRSTYTYVLSPNSFVLAGSNDGTTWTLIESRNTPIYTQVANTFYVTGNTVAYRFYRLITTVVGNNDITSDRTNVNIGEWELFAVPSTTARFVGEYPPAAMTADSANLSTAAYGRGTYVASASTTWDVNWPPNRAFRKNETTRVGWMSQNRYDTAGAYTGTETTNVNGVGVTGEWLQIQFPAAVQLSSYSISTHSLNNCPRAFQLVASISGADNTWVLLDTQSNLTWDSNLTPKVYQINAQAAFSYFRIITTETVGNTERIRAILSFIRLYGALTPTPTEWPPSAMTANTSTISGRVYVASVSSMFDTTNYPPRNAFDRSPSLWICAANYNTTSGNYLGSTSTTVSGSAVTGEWVQIQLPSSILISSFAITPQGTTGFGEVRSPRSFVLAGSNDGTTWFTITDRTGIVDWVSGTTKTFNASSTTAFSQYRLITRIIGNDSTTLQSSKNVVSIAELRLFGTSGDLLNPMDDRGMFTPIASQNVSLGQGPPSRKSQAQTAIVLSGNTAGTTAAGGVVSFMEYSCAQMAMTATSGMTLAFWAYPTSSTTSARQFLATLTNPGASSRDGIYTMVIGSNRITCGANYGTNGTSIWSTELTYTAPASIINTWIHVAVTVQVPNMTLFVNGVQIATTNTVSSANTWFIDGLRLGYLLASGTTPREPFNGRIVDILVYQRALSVTEIADIAGLNRNATAILEFDASDLSLGTVTTWANKGTLGSAFNATNVGTVSCRTDALGKFVYLNSSSLSIGTPGTSGITWNFDATGVQGVTFVVVMSSPVTGSSFENYLQFRSSSTTVNDSLNMYRSSTTSTIRYSHGDAAGTNHVVSINNMLTGVFDIHVFSTTSTTRNVYLNGVSVSSGTWVTSITNKTTTFNNIGGGMDNSIRQVIVYNRPLSAAQVSTLTHQLRQKWGIGNERLMVNKITTNTPLLWLRSDELAGLPTDSTISSWPSALGANANAFQAGTATLPVIKREGGQQRAYVRLGIGATTNASNGNWLDFGAQNFRLATNGGFTAIMMVRQYSATSFERIFDFGASGGNDLIYIARSGVTNNASILYRNALSNFATTTVSSVLSTNWQVIALRVVPNDVTFYDVNGTPIPVPTAPTSLTDKLWTFTYIGRSSVAADSYANLDVREMMFFDRGLSDVEIGDLRSYLMNKYR
jgi:hypothetical protein